MGFSLISKARAFFSKRTHRMLSQHAHCLFNCHTAPQKTASPTVSPDGRTRLAQIRLNTRLPRPAKLTTQHMPTQHQPSKSASDSDVPGPGSYRAEGATRHGEKLAWNAPNRGTCLSAFKATPHSLVLSGCKESPPPTKYNLVSPAEAPSLAGIDKVQHGESCSGALPPNWRCSTL